MTLKAQDIFPQLKGLGDDDKIPTPLTYEPLLAALAHEVLVSGEDPNPQPGGEEGHRYFLLGGGLQPGQNFGVLILARYFNDDPCLESLDYIDEAQAAVNFVRRKVFWSATMVGAIARIQQVLGNREAGHAEAGSKFLEAARAISPDKICEVLARNW